jgi:N-acetylmuramoyl-L-alanine amidase
MAKIVLDPGHGGTAKLGGSSANNAVGQGGLLEKTVTLDVGLRAEKILTARGHTVKLTRKADNNVGLSSRAAVAKAIAAPVFVSIHLNGFNKATQGTETLCDTLHSSLSADLCRAVQKRMVEATGHSDRNKGHAGGVKRQPLGVLKSGSHHPKTACCLVEISFMDVAAEEARLKTNAYLDKIATALADGIGDYLEAGSIEAVAAKGSFEDGFQAGGGKAVPLPKAASPSAEHGESVKQGKKAAAPKGARPVSAAAMNDRHEFAEIPIGEGFDPSVPDTESLAMTEAPGFDLTAFRNFVATLGLRHFSASELLFMGNSNASGSCMGKNSFPPATLWPRIANTAKMLDEIRERLGASCRILSAYRSPAYNTCIGGESASLHMQFNAIDFHCVTGSSAQWHAVAKAVRASKVAFKGGIGLYSSFVHIDTRGTNANWNG